jgi:uncharacterized protein YydD (DUF2326 family)
MFLRSLVISTPAKVIREIPFHKGINLIVDESEEQITGNNVGKTTLLRLIDFCLGGDAKAIYIENVVIKRNFLSRKEAIREVNGESVAKEDFENKLSELLLPDLQKDKPTFRQAISHNIRHSDLRISSTLKTLDSYTTDAEYETLYLHLFGCDFE